MQGLPKGKPYYAGPSPAQLVPSSTMYHKLPSMSRFVESNADEYAREYGEYFQEEFKKFEKNLECLKKEIQMN